MATLPNGFPISLRSWPTKSANATDLPTLFQRIQTERGGFLNINEETLHKEIAQQESGEVLEEESEDEEDKNAEDVKARAAARQELLQQITTAHHSALNSLNFVSLLLSKSNPAAVSATISPELRDLIPLGTLGATKANSAWITQERKDDNKTVAKGWKSRDVTKSIDSILESATRLENEIQKETLYWEEILGLHDKGWSVSKIPRRKDVMGVRLGSSEASSVLRSQGLATLTRGENGSVKLTTTPTTTNPRTLRVRIQVNNVTTGTSTVPMALPQSASVSSHVLQTRNTLFALELWHEINRESRILGAFNISSRDETLIFPLTSTKTAILDLHPLLSPADSGLLSQEDDSQAQAIYISLNLLLSYSHRQTLRNRSRPPKPKPNPKRQQTTQGPPRNKEINFNDSLTLLRPLLTLLNHQSSLTQLHTLMSLLTRTLFKTSITPPPTYTLVPVHANPPSFLSSAERSISILTNYLLANITLQILPDTELKIFVQTKQSPFPTSVFTIQIHPEEAELGMRCPSPGLLYEVDKVVEYVLFVSAAALALRFSSAPEDGKMDSKARWCQTHNPPTLKLSVPTSSLPAKADGKLLHFSLHRILSSPSANRRNGMKLRVTYTFSPPPRHELDTSALVDSEVLKAIVGEKMWRDSDGDEEGKETKEKGKVRAGEGVYEWVAWEEDRKSGDREVEEAIRSVEDVVEEAAK